MPKFDWPTLKRLFTYIFVPYKLRFLVVLCCILVSALASVAGSLFLRILIDTYIVPMAQNPETASFTR